MATQVYDGLFVGSQYDIYKFAGSVLHCAKSPWFDQAAANIRLLEKLGDPRGVLAAPLYPSLLNGNVIQVEYNEMALNMVDSESPKYFGDEMVNAGLQFISDRMAEGDPVLVHCNVGVSRSPSMAFLWMFEHGFLDDDYETACEDFQDLYPDWFPGAGIKGYLDKRCRKPEPTNSDPRGWFIDGSFGEED